MRPLTARVGFDGPLVLILAFVAGPAEPMAVVVNEAGRIETVGAAGLVIDRPSPDFPIGYTFSAAQNAELVR